MIDLLTEYILQEGVIMGASPNMINRLPKILLNFLKEKGYTEKDIKEHHKWFGSFRNHDCKKWEDYKGREYLCTAKWNFAKQLQLYMFVSTDHGDAWAYSFKKREIFFYNHESNVFPFQTLTDKKYLATPIWPEEDWDTYGKETYGEGLKKDPWPKDWTRRWKVNDWIKAVKAKKKFWFHIEAGGSFEFTKD